jgi:4-amino-4-deoxychorismate lyase
VSLLALAVHGRGLVDPSEPIVHADDEGLLRGRAAFETLRVYGGRPFKLDEHLERLAASASRLGLPEFDVSVFEELCGEAVSRADGNDAMLRFYWTPGREGEGRPKAFALLSTIPPDYDELRHTGIRVVSLPLAVEPDVRATAPWLLGGVKSTSYAINMAADQEAHRRGADDAVFLASGGIVLEGPTTNMWWRLERTLYTPALELGILAGVTRATLIAEAAGLGYEMREGIFPLEHLAAAEEAFSSSSVREVMPVVELDGTIVGAGVPGPAAAKLQRALRAAAGVP